MNKNSFQTCQGELTDPLQIVSEFNKYFSTVGSNLSNQAGNSILHFSHYMPPSQCQSAVFNMTDRKEVISAIQVLKNSMRVGFDSASQCH